MAIANGRQVFCIFRCSDASGAPATIPIAELLACRESAVQRNAFAVGKVSPVTCPRTTDFHSAQAIAEDLGTFAPWVFAFLDQKSSPPRSSPPPTTCSPTALVIRISAPTISPGVTQPVPPPSSPIASAISDSTSKSGQRHDTRRGHVRFLDSRSNLRCHYSVATISRERRALSTKNNPDAAPRQQLPFSPTLCVGCLLHPINAFRSAKEPRGNSLSLRGVPSAL